MCQDVQRAHAIASAPRRARCEVLADKNMIQTVRISNFGEYMSRHFVDVFGGVLCLPATLSDKLKAPPMAGRVIGSVGFAGPTVAGAVYVHFSEPFARCATAAMLGLAPEEISSPGEVNGGVGEVANLLTAGLKSWLCEAGVPCAMSAPAIIRGTAYTIEPMPDMERETLVFECGDEFVVVEVHVQLTQT